MSEAGAKKKKAKQSQPVRDYLLYLLLRVAAVLVHLAGVEAALGWARQLGRGLWLAYGRGRERALDNLRCSFPEQDEAWRRRVARRSFEHLVMLAFDVLFTTRLIRLSTWRRHLELADLEQALALLLSGRGVILVTGHYGNFEILGYALATLGLESYAIARPIDNPYVNRYLLGVRQRQGQMIIDKKGATAAMLEVLRSGAALAFIADQNAGRKGLFVDFFGRKASTYKSIGLLALEYDLPIVVGYARRVGDRYRFRLGVSRIIRPEEWRGRADPLEWITAEYTAGIERFVREEPEQYWWVHRRWKTQPKEKANSAQPTAQTAGEQRTRN